MDKLRLDPAMIDRARDAARGIAEEVDRFTAQRTTVATERTVLRLMGVDGVNADGVPLPNVVVDHVHERGLLGRGGGLLDGRGRRALRPDAPGGGRARGRRRPRSDARRRRRRGSGAGDGRGAGPSRPGRHRQKPPPARGTAGAPRRRAAAAPLRYRGHRGHLRGRAPGPRRRPAGGRHHRCHPQHGAEPARLRALWSDAGGLRRHLRHPGQLPHHARGPRRGGRGDRPLHPPVQLLLRPVHAGNRRHGRPRAARRDAERRPVRHPVPRHQHAAHADRPVLLADAQQLRRHRHQHRRRQLPDHRRRRGGGPHGARLPVHQRAVRPLVRSAAAADGVGPRFRNGPDVGRRLSFRARPGPARPPDLPRRADQVHAAHQAHDGKHLPRPRPGRAVQPRRHHDPPGHPAPRDDDGGPAHALHPGPRLAIEAAKYIFTNARHLADEIRFKPGGIIERRAQEVLRKAVDLLEEVRRIGLFAALERGLFADVKRSRDGGRGLDGVIRKDPAYWNPFEDRLRAELGLPPREVIVP